jgi:hypothetical protein
VVSELLRCRAEATEVMVSSISGGRSTSPAEAFNFNNTASSGSRVLERDLFARQLTTAIEGFGKQGPQGQNSGTRQFNVTPMDSSTPTPTAATTTPATMAPAGQPYAVSPDENGTTAAVPSGFSTPQTVATLASMESYQEGLNNSPAATPAFLAQQAKEVAASVAAAPWLANLPGYDGATNTQATAEMYAGLYGDTSIVPSQYAGPATAQNAAYQAFMPGGEFAGPAPPVNTPAA